MKKMQLLSTEYLPFYQKKQKFTLRKHLNTIDKKKYNPENFELFSGESSVFSSQIEGSTVTESDWLNYKMSGIGKGTERIKEVQDLQNAYTFCRANKISKKNILEVHKISSNTILKDKAYKGKIRKVQVYVGNSFKIIYTCASPDIVEQEFNKLVADIEYLNTQNLTVNEVFYFASLIHLMYVKIHPFADGNGRTARLLEKWFLAQHLGAVAWYIRSEKHYRTKKENYYKYLNDCGDNYNKLVLGNCLPFLMMLPFALRNSH